MGIKIEIGGLKIWGGSSVTSALNGDPSNLVLTIISDTSIKLDWTIGSTNQTGHRIERGTDGVNFTDIGFVTGSTSTYTDTGLTANTLYYYRVRAYKS